MKQEQQLMKLKVIQVLFYLLGDNYCSELSYQWNNVSLLLLNFG